MNLKDSDNKLIELDALYGYKTMLEWHRNNLEKYLIYQGIYDIYPEITDEEAELFASFVTKMQLKIRIFWNFHII